jgi:hypothetical protein
VAKRNLPNDVITFFSTWPLDGAEVVFDIARGVMKGRREREQPRGRKPAARPARVTPVEEKAVN